MDPAILSASMASTCLSTLACLVFVLIIRNRKGGYAPGSGGGSWNTGYATYYNSWPRCCKGSSVYDPKAPTAECTQNNGCAHQGKFAGFNGVMPVDEVKRRNIVAFYDDRHQNTNRKDATAWWNANAKNKKIEIRNPASGKTMVVDVLDTCGNHDCPANGGCCHNNASKGGGYLLDLEGYTSARFWGKEQNGNLEWRWV